MARKQIKNIFTNLWETLDGKKTLIGDWGTYLVVGVDVLEKLATDPNVHTVLNSVGLLFPSWAIYITLGISTLGRVHKGVKILKELFVK